MNIRDLLQELKIPTAPEGHHHTTHGRIQIDCPWCSKDSRRWRLGIRTDGSYWCHCWTCGSHKLSETLAEAAGVASQTVTRLVGHLVKEFAPQRTQTAGKLVLPGRRGRLLPVHKQFLNKRGFDPAEIQVLWDIEGIPLHPTLSNRIFIPIKHNGDTVSWTTRATGSGVPYLSARPDQEAITHKSLLYGEDYCRHTILIQEGPLDVWAIGPGAVCTFGLQYTREQLLLMSKYPVRVVMFDNEPEAQVVAAKLCSDLSVFDGETFNVVLSGKDASRSPRKEINAVRERFLS